MGAGSCQKPKADLCPLRGIGSHGQGAGVVCAGSLLPLVTQAFKQLSASSDSRLSQPGMWQLQPVLATPTLRLGSVLACHALCCVLTVASLFQLCQCDSTLLVSFGRLFSASKSSHACMKH